jgi:hypothetical protein
MTHRAAGKYVSGDFIAERMVRYFPRLRSLFALCRPLMRHVYVNPLDEMILVARPI